MSTGQLRQTTGEITLLVTLLCRKTLGRMRVVTIRLQVLSKLDGRWEAWVLLFMRWALAHDQ